MANGETIDIRIERHKETVVIRPSGDIDLNRSPSLREQLRRAADKSTRRMVVDLGDVPYMDSSGVATLVEAMQLARRGGYTLVLCGLQDRVRSIFEIARLDTVFQVVSDVNAAMSS